MKKDDQKPQTAPKLPGATTAQRPPAPQNKGGTGVLRGSKNVLKPGNG